MHKLTDAKLYTVSSVGFKSDRFIEVEAKEGDTIKSEYPNNLYMIIQSNSMKEGDFELRFVAQPRTFVQTEYFTYLLLAAGIVLTIVVLLLFTLRHVWSRHKTTVKMLQKKEEEKPNQPSALPYFGDENNEKLNNIILNKEKSK